MVDIGCKQSSTGQSVGWRFVLASLRGFVVVGVVRRRLPCHYRINWYQSVAVAQLKIVVDVVSKL
jgi:hypothetical protein